MRTNPELVTRQKLEETQYRVLTILKGSGHRHLDVSGLSAMNLNSSVQLLKALQAIEQTIHSRQGDLRTVALGDRQDLCRYQPAGDPGRVSIVPQSQPSIDNS